MSIYSILYRITRFFKKLGLPALTAYSVLTNIQTMMQWRDDSQSATENYLIELPPTLLAFFVFVLYYRRECNIDNMATYFDDLSMLYKYLRQKTKTLLNEISTASYIMTEMLKNKSNQNLEVSIQTLSTLKTDLTNYNIKSYFEYLAIFKNPATTIFLIFDVLKIFPTFFSLVADSKNPKYASMLVALAALVWLIFTLKKWANVHKNIDQAQSLISFNEKTNNDVQVLSEENEKYSQAQLSIWHEIRDLDSYKKSVKQNTSTLVLSKISALSRTYFNNPNAIVNNHALTITTFFNVANSNKPKETKHDENSYSIHDETTPLLGSKNGVNINNDDLGFEILEIENRSNDNRQLISSKGLAILNILQALLVGFIIAVPLIDITKDHLDLQERIGFTAIIQIIISFIYGYLLYQYQKYERNVEEMFKGTNNSVTDLDDMHTNLASIKITPINQDPENTSSGSCCIL